MLRALLLACALSSSFAQTIDPDVLSGWTLHGAHGINGRNNESYSKLLELVLKDELGNGSRPSASPGLVSEEGRLRLAPLPAGLPPELPARTFSYPDMRNTNSRRARTVPSASPRGAVPLTTADGDAPTRALDSDSPRESAARWLERTQM